MANISSIKLPNGTTYTLKDNGALQLTGGQVTGPVTFGDTVSIDEATLGDLVVNGSASFTNNLQVNTINGVTVGNSPKFTDTTYTRGTATSGGTTLSLVNTGDMYTWNNKQDKLTNPVTGTGTSGYLVKWNGSTTVTNGPQLGSSTTTYLNNAGNWTTPPNTTYTFANGTNGFTVTPSGGTAQTVTVTPSIADNLTGTKTTATLGTTWSSNQQSVTVSGVTTSNTIIVTPTPASYDAYCEAGIYCSAQASNSLTFKCDTAPSVSLAVNIMIIN